MGLASGTMSLQAPWVDNLAVVPYLLLSHRLFRTKPLSVLLFSGAVTDSSLVSAHDNPYTDRQRRALNQSGYRLEIGQTRNVFRPSDSRTVRNGVRFGILAK